MTVSLAASPAASELLPLAVACPLTGAALLAVLGRRLPRSGTDALATAWAAGQLALVWWLAAATGGAGRTVTWVGGWTPVEGRSVGIVLVADGLGLGLAVLVALLVLAALGYAWRYFEEPERARGHGGGFPALLLLFEAGTTGFALTGDLFNAFVFFELMGVAGYALTGYRVEEPRPLQGALAFAVTGSLAGYLALVGVGLLYARTGELSFAGIARELAGQPADALVTTAAALLCCAMLVKAAAVPFHFWLPDAHAEAPTPVCLLLSGVMVELGLYGLLRVYLTVFSGTGGVPHEVMRGTLIAVGTVTALTGALLCWQQRHLKRLLAFSTVGHMGLFLCGAGLLDAEATAGTALYVAGHAGVKGPLFCLAGVLLDRHASVDEHGLWGRARDMPLVGVLFAVGGCALAGLPPFGTGLGKSLVEHAAHEDPWLVALFVLVPAVTAGAVLRAAARVFAGAGTKPRERHSGAETTGAGEEPEVSGPRREVPRPMLVVPAVLLAGALAVGLVPALWRYVAAGSVLFHDPAGYGAAVTGVPGGGGTGTAPPPEVAWSLPGILFGLLSTALAAGCAAGALWGPALHGRLARTARAGADAVDRTVVLAVRRQHSGHVGDYVAWLLAGLAALTAVFALWG
ncbi:complex I subunit 5 family protein [Streptomyces sp. SKN60]|uniref:complex I subunit 5 family protein n=1 Tax=Streptomyces sp. SKN60 TaxID=2855506 RepID=UPI0022480EE6|nr:complex I subunit 5 family protein [Streptomyces sp. SKN60]